MLTAHHVNAFLVIGICLIAAVTALVARRRGAGKSVAQVIALAQTLVVAQVGLGLLLLSDHHRAKDHLHYAYGTFALTSDAGDQISLESLRGKQVVLYFYPTDDSRGSY